MSETWQEWAESILWEGWRDAIEGAISTMAAARWHPNGFMVFRIDEVEEGEFRGSRRVHIWPGSIARREMPGHPTIHSHDWELESLVLEGQYSDVIFKPAESSDELIAHAVTYGGSAGDSINPTDGRVRLERTAVRVVARGELHHMDVGVPHETLVPADETVVTHVLMGPRQVDGMMLAAASPFTAVSFERPSLDSREQESARATLEHVLAQRV